LGEERITIVLTSREEIEIHDLPDLCKFCEVLTSRGNCKSSALLFKKLKSVHIKILKLLIKELKDGFRNGFIDSEGDVDGEIEQICVEVKKIRAGNQWQNLVKMVTHSISRLNTLVPSTASHDRTRSAYRNFREYELY
jgi:hypothetical protein